MKACRRNLLETHPTVVRGVEGTAGQATVACLPQSRARQEAAGHGTIESSTRCTCLLQSNQLQEFFFFGVKTLTQLSRRFLTGAALWEPVGM